MIERRLHLCQNCYHDLLGHRLQVMYMAEPEIQPEQMPSDYQINVSKIKAPAAR